MLEDTDKIAISMSGGLDSSLLAYLLCKEISDKNADNIEVHDDSGDLDNIDDMLNNLLIQNNESHDGVNNVDYSKMTVSELKKILVEKNLPVSGNKTKLIKRITENE